MNGLMYSLLNSPLLVRLVGVLGLELSKLGLHKNVVGARLNVVCEEERGETLPTPR